MSSEPTITLYDIPSALPSAPYSPSPNVWKIRYALNFKGLQFSTIWVEYPDIKPLYEKLGAAAALTKTDGTPFHTLPLISDASTGAIVSESFAIAQYLDKTYPDTPRLFPLGPPSYPLHAAFNTAFRSQIGPLFQFTLPAMHRALTPGSQGYFNATKASILGAPTLEDGEPKGAKRAEEWEKVKAGFDGIAKWSVAGHDFFVGDAISWPDIEVGAFVLWIRTLLGAESPEWKAASSWNEGRWARLLDALAPYEVVTV
ncbi:hypothetical protein BDZ89DRAFT_953614 [Hymenopellis radicata]|nr:hypothetical protein BDZ89DRAFT_953614 [Hymenopellis radicata]